MSGSNAANLLRLLEPAVRPGNLPRSAQPSSTPIESRSFDSILEEAQSLNAAGGAAAARGDGENAAPVKQASPLAGLGRIDCVENAGLRDLLARAAASRETTPGDGRQSA